MSASHLINAINAAADSPPDLNDEERTALLAASDRLKTKLENPREALIRILFAPHQSVALRLAVDMGLFDAAAALSGDGSEIKITDLASKTEADPLLIARVMRFLYGMGIFKQVGQEAFHATPVSKYYVTASPLAQAIIHITHQNEINSALPAYFAAKGYQNPDDAYNGPFQYVRQTPLHCFDWLATQPRLQHAFNVVMGISRSTESQSWFSYFPVPTELAPTSESPSDPESPLLVDVGGGVGHDLIAFRAAFPDLKGELILQEIPVVIDSIPSPPPGITLQKHDFFSPQPIKNARAYFLSNILHDWPDKQALIILKNIREAMGQQSMVLLSENVLPEVGVDLNSASADFMMMGNFSSLERTGPQFEELLGSAGLRVTGTWKQDGEGGRKVIKAMLT